MNRVFGAALMAALLTGVAVLGGAPAKADVAIGFSFGVDGGYFSDPCDYYDYYDQPPPWGLPPDYCEYPVYFEPIYVGGSWYRGPVYYRWYGGDRLFWINGRWRRDEWRGPRPQIRWTDRGGWHARGAWGNNGWGGRNDLRRDDHGAWNRDGDWNRRNDFRDRDHSSWNRGADWNQHNDFHGGERRSWNDGDRGNWNRGSAGNQRNDFRGVDHQGWQSENRGGPRGGDGPRGGEQSGRGGRSGHGGGDHHDRH